MKKRAKVENHISLERDLSTSAIVNTDTTAYARYMNEKEVRMRHKNEIDSLRGEIELLKSLIINKS
jgi:hypothetical protein|tara:strand:- start:123 stop:320 length:198 start_codon:yes stop_codon:yes gene_type:complete